MVAYNYLIKTNLVNEIRFGYASPVRSLGPNGKIFDGFAPAQQAGILGVRPDAPKGAGAPDSGISGLTGSGTGREGLTLSNNWQFANNLTWIKGRHSLMFAVDIRRLRTTVRSQRVFPSRPAIPGDFGLARANWWDLAPRTSPPGSRRQSRLRNALSSSWRAHFRTRSNHPNFGNPALVVPNADFGGSHRRRARKAAARGIFRWDCGCDFRAAPGFPGRHRDLAR